MLFEVIIMKRELDCLEETAYNIMRKQHVRKTDRKIIVESFKGIKGKLRKIKGNGACAIIGANDRKLPSPKKFGLRGFSWNAGEWNLVFLDPPEDYSPIEDFFENEINWENVIDYECSWSPK